MILSLALVSLIGAPILLSADEKAPGPETRRVAFAQYCFWTGEMKLGQIDGVVRTEAGYFKGREVTLVDYVPAKISLEELARRAKQAGVADSIHLDGAQRSIAGVPAGAPLDSSYRAAPANDQKKQMEGTPLARLRLTPEQATKVNAFVREDFAKALEPLTSAQQAQVRGAR